MSKTIQGAPTSVSIDATNVEEPRTTAAPGFRKRAISEEMRLAMRDLSHLMAARPNQAKTLIRLLTALAEKSGRPTSAVTGLPPTATARAGTTPLKGPQRDTVVG
jgi:hypothetical protein